jgi:hypothetical protein
LLSSTQRQWLALQTRWLANIHIFSLSGFKAVGIHFFFPVLIFF